MKELDEIRARLEAAAEGPWRWDENFDPEGDKDSGLALTNGTGVEIIGAYNHHCCSCRDDPIVDEVSAALIAHAPTDLARLLAALDAALKLAEEWRYKGEYGWGAWQEGHGPDPEGYMLDTASGELRAALTAALKETL